MVKNLPGEQWKEINFDFEFINNYRLEVSNLGRLRTYNKLYNGKILNGSTVNGYKIIQLKFFTARDPQVKTLFDSFQKEALELSRKIKLLEQSGASKNDVAEAINELENLKKSYNKHLKDDVKKRTINYHSLVHRLVADHFCHKPSANHTVVAHMDFNKLNNRSDNLKWMTKEENFLHQQKSPNVIALRTETSYLDKKAVRAAKLSVTKVMLLKKLLNQGKPLKTLVKQFKITDTQILRIKRGENWANIPAAK